MTKCFIYFSFLCISILCFSCAEKNTREKLISIEDFPLTKSLKGSAIKEIKNNFFAYLMGLKDSILIFCDTEHSPHFYAYKVPEFKYLGNFGQQGKGPADTPDPVFWGQFIKSNGSYKTWIYQMNLMKLSLIDINKALTSSTYEPEKVIRMPPQIGSAVNIISLDDNIFIGSGNKSDGEFFIYNASTKKLEWKNFFIDYDENFMELLIKSDKLDEYKRGIIKIKPDGSRFVKAFTFIPIIDIYNQDGKIEFSLILKNHEKPNINLKVKQFEGSTKVYYENVFLTDNYIYALNRNCNLEDYSKNICKDAEIHVYSWDGNAVCKYKLNEGIGPVAPFVVDEANKRVYTVNPKDDNDYYSVFEIGNELNIN